MFREGQGGGGLGGRFREGRWGGFEWGDFGGYTPPMLSVGPSQGPLTSLCPPYNHAITLIQTITFVATCFSHATHA